MMGLTGAMKAFACTHPTDLRAGFDTLFALVRDVLELDPLSGYAFAFVNRSRTRCKVLLYDGTGLLIVMKRLERGRFVAPWERSSDSRIEMTMSELVLLVEGSTSVLRTSLSPKRVEPAPLHSPSFV